MALQRRRFTCLGTRRSILTPTDVFYVAMAALIVAYLGCAWLTRSHFGRVCVGHPRKRDESRNCSE